MQIRREMNQNSQQTLWVSYQRTYTQGHQMGTVFKGKRICHIWEKEALFDPSLNQRNRMRTSIRSIWNSDETSVNAIQRNSGIKILTGRIQKHNISVRKVNIISLVLRSQIVVSHVLNLSQTSMHKGNTTTLLLLSNHLQLLL